MNRMTAGLVAGGTFLCVVATPLLLGSVYAGALDVFVVLQGFEGARPSSLNEVMAWTGWFALGIGALMLATGLFRLIAYPRARVGDAGEPHVQAATGDDI